MNAFLSQILPVLYGACFLVLLWQAFKVMAQGFKAVPRPGDPSSASRADRSTVGNSPTSATGPSRGPGDRTGRVTIHPELLDAEGQITQEDLLTVRFSGDNEQSARPADSSD
jgi:hypothetical protein